MNAVPATNGSAGAAVPAHSVRYRTAAFRDHLFAKGELTEQDWRLAREVARQHGSTELRALLDLGLLSEESIAANLSSCFGVPRWDLKHETRSISAHVPREFMASSGTLVLEAKQVIVQKVRDAEREHQYEEYKGRVSEIVHGIVKRVEYGNVIVDLGRGEAIIRRDETLPRESFRKIGRAHV